MINTELFKSTMEKIHNKIVNEKKVLVENDINVNEKDGENIDSIIEKTADTSFKLLVMGRFSSGKSAFVNVILGEKILPENALPSTALITEVYYGTEKKVVMYPRKGKWQGGNEPFEIEPTLSEIKKYSTINNKAGLNTKEANRVDSSFEKMVVYWPLEMLKDGVSIVDSPGTDDPYCNDYIVESYVPKADAILYCVNGTNVLTAKDKETLDRLKGLGYEPIIVTTYYDVVTEGMDESDKQDFLDTTYDTFYSSYNTKDACHYVNSRLGLASKANNSQSDYIESGYCELEDFLGKYLTENKGLEKIGIATSSVMMFNSMQNKRIDAIIDNLSVPLEDFDERVKEAEKDLEQAKKRGELLLREFNVDAKSEKLKIHDMIPSLYDELYENITLDDFVPATNFSMWHPKKCATQIAEECSKEIEIRKKALIEKWSNEKFMPAIMRSFKIITEKMSEQLNDFAADIKKANITVSASGKYEKDSSDITKTAMCIANWAVGGIISGIGSEVYGIGGLARNIVCQIGAYIALLIAAEFTPIGWGATLIAAIVAAVVGGNWNASVMGNKIKNTTVSEIKKALADEKEKMIANVKNQCDKIFDDAEKKLKSTIDEDVNSVRKTIDLIRADRNKYIDKIETRKAELETVKKFVGDASTEMDSIRKEFNI